VQKQGEGEVVQMQDLGDEVRMGCRLFEEAWMTDGVGEAVQVLCVQQVMEEAKKYSGHWGRRWRDCVSWMRRKRSWIRSSGDHVRVVTDHECQCDSSRRVNMIVPQIDVTKR
jgi:hypothetical protein